MQNPLLKTKSRGIRLPARLACGIALVLGGRAAAMRAAPAQTHNRPSAESVLRELDREAKGLHDLSADIERTTVTAVVNDKSTETGRMFMRTDGKMRIEFAKPDQRTILRNRTVELEQLYAASPAEFVICIDEPQ